MEGHPQSCDPGEVSQGGSLPWASQVAATTTTKSLHLCLPLCNSMDCSPPGSSVHGVSKSGLPPPPGDLPDRGIDPGIEPTSLMSTTLQTSSHACNCRRYKRYSFDFCIRKILWRRKYSSILAWRIPWREEPGGLQSMELQRVGHN